MLLYLPEKCCRREHVKSFRSCKGCQEWKVLVLCRWRLTHHCRACPLVILIEELAWGRPCCFVCKLSQAQHARFCCRVAASLFPPPQLLAVKGFVNIKPAERAGLMCHSLCVSAVVPTHAPGWVRGSPSLSSSPFIYLY